MKNIPQSIHGEATETNGEGMSMHSNKLHEQLAEKPGARSVTFDKGPSQSWRDHAYPLRQITIQLQGTKHSDRAHIIGQLDTVLTRLRAGDLKGQDHDDDFGYRFTVESACAGPSFFDEPAGSN